MPASVGVKAPEEPECGLVGDGGELGLEHVQIECKVVDVLAKISIYQQYYNALGKEIEAKYV